MESFEGKIAVVTGGGTGMGRELLVQLAAEGCHVAACDVIVNNLDETARRAEKDAPAGTRITVHRADVADESDIKRFAQEVFDQHDTDHVNLVFNNAGVGGGGSFPRSPPGRSGSAPSTSAGAASTTAAGRSSRSWWRATKATS